jgi:type 1 glutamine amidotransferase
MKAMVHPLETAMNVAWPLLLLFTGLVDYEASAALPAEARQRILDALPRQAAVAPRRPRRLLIFNRHVHDGKVLAGHASIPHGNFALERMGARTGAYTAEIRRDVAVFRPKALERFDAVCFNNTAGVLFEDPLLRESLLAFVRDGGGFVGIHAAGATFVQWPRYDHWPAYGDMLGGYEDGGHPWGPQETIFIRVEDPGHPLNAAFDGRGFAIQDEVFQFRHGYTREKLRVLLSIDTDRTDMSPQRRFLPERATDRDFAMSWVRAHGRGRVFYTSFGHNPEIFQHPPLLRHFLDAIQFALGDLEASTLPSADRDPRSGDASR